ncbi:MAG: hypothetical protein H6Q69_5082 [Firmicutes bacterium]|nr:hypothetical protein [Bacillota bacterium]
MLANDRFMRPKKLHIILLLVKQGNPTEIGGISLFSMQPSSGIS